jgi:hypothetical protein
MKKTFKLFGAVALVIAVAFTMAACSSGGSGTPPQNTGSIPGLTTGSPPAKTLTDLGLPADIMNTLLEAARAVDSDYLGYQHSPEDKILIFFWKNKKAANIDKMVDRLTEKLKPLTTPFSNDDIFRKNAVYNNYFGCEIVLLMDGITYPEGTMLVGFGDIRP